MIRSKADWLHERLGTVVLWVLLIGLESAGQIATKVGGDELGQMDFNLQWLLAVAANTGVWLAIACYIAAFFVWMLILRRSHLSLAFPLSSLVFVGVLLGILALVGGAHQRAALVGSSRDHGRDCVVGRG